MKTKTLTRPTLAYLDVAIAQMRLQGWRRSGAVVKVDNKYKQEMVRGEWKPGPSETKALTFADYVRDNYPRVTRDSRRHPTADEVEPEVKC